MKPTTIDQYFSVFPEETIKRMQELRDLIHKLAPEVKESISYSMPAFKLNNSALVYFAGYKNHIGLYPTPSGIEEFQKDFSNYKTGKGSIQFPLDQPMPWDLITRIVKFRINETAGKAKTGKKY